MDDETILNTSSQDEKDPSKLERVNPYIEREISKVFIKEMEKGNVLPILTGKQIADCIVEHDSLIKEQERKDNMLKNLPRIKWLNHISDATSDLAEHKFTPNLKELEIYLNEEKLRLAEKEKLIKKERDKFNDLLRKPTKNGESSIELSDEDIHTYIVISRALAESPLLRNNVTVSNRFFIEKYIVSTNKCTKEQASKYFEEAKMKKILIPLDTLEDDKTYYYLNDIKEKEQN